MVSIPAGRFLRGSPPGQGLPNEEPQRELWLSGFELDVLPVTCADFQAFLDAGGYSEPSHWSTEGWAARTEEGWERPRFWGEAEWAHVTGPTQPVVGVSFHEAEAYARFVGKRLPTEAEWEKAARGTDGRVFPWGDDWEEGRCSFRGGNKRAAPPVGQFPEGVSVFGVWEMCGGVWELCSDWYDEHHYAVAPEKDPRGPEHGTLKVARGGAWNALPLLNRTANRNAWRPRARFSNIGFRCAR
jgi:formylglycine-generating enzyme required for sulfatase activity